MTVVDLYTIQIVRDDDAPTGLGSLRFLMAEMEENLTDLLPAGYRARIRRWDHADEEERECEHKWRDFGYGQVWRDCGTSYPDEGENDE